MKQTAVDFIIHYFENPHLYKDFNWIQIKTQAKEMEREQMASNCSQVEISDDEIEELTIKKFYELQKKRKTLHHWSWVNGMKMYREQLKQK